MTSIYQRLLALCPAPWPEVRAVHICADKDNPNAKFGVVELDDGSIGLTYTKLGDAFGKLQDKDLYQAFLGKPADRLGQLSESAEPWQQVLGAGVLNAISQRLLKQRGFEYSKAADTLELLAIQPGERVGMVGYFPPLVAQLREDDVAVTVIELKPELVQQEGNFEVTMEPARLAQCDKVLITGTSVINHTLEGLLGHCTRAKEIALIGPSVGLLPDLLFEQGVTILGGRAVLDGPAFLERWRSGEKWKQSVVRYSLRKGDYFS